MKKGFSLVELSIVLVILGLLVGGILAGQSLIRASELRSIVSDLQRYKAAHFAFRDKYLAIAGDMVNATNFWGAQDPDPATCYVTPSTTQATCNGNGDGMIYSNDGDVTAGEEFRYWQQMANAGLIEGKYTGVTGPLSYRNSVPGSNVPASKMPNTGYSISWRGSPDPSNAAVYIGNYDNPIQFGKKGTNRTGYSVLVPSDQWNMDLKTDDGMPAQGKFRTGKRGSTNGGNCATSTDPTVAVYDLTLTTGECTIFFIF